jgi:hypothetical protein
MEDLKDLRTKEFISSAREYCDFIEEAAAFKPVELFESLQYLLAKVYSHTALIRKPRYCYEDQPRKFVHENEYARIHDRLQGIIQKFRGHGSLKQTRTEAGMDIVSFSLAESLTDIYQELKDSHSLYEVGLSQAMNDSIWWCRDSFEKLWGLQLIETMQSIHQLLYGHQLTSNQLQMDDEDIVGDETDENWFSEEDDIPYGEE